jgi:hypothetical protein
MLDEPASAQQPCFHNSQHRALQMRVLQAGDLSGLSAISVKKQRTFTPWEPERQESFFSDQNASRVLP